MCKHKQLKSPSLEQSGHEQSLGCWRGRKVQGWTFVLHPVWASELVHVTYDLQIMRGWSLGQAAGPLAAHVGPLQLWALCLCVVPALKLTVWQSAQSASTISSCTMAQHVPLALT